MDYQVIVQAGGKGTRLLPLTLEKPKPLLDIDGKTLIEHAIQPFITAGFTKFVVTASYKAEMIKKYLKEKGIDAVFITEEKPAGRAGAIKLGIEQGLLDPTKPTLQIHCDDIIKVNIKDFIQIHEKLGCSVTLGLSNQYQNPYGTVNTKNSKIISFEEKPRVDLPHGTGINTGLSVFKNLEMFQNIKMPANAEDVIYPDIAKKGEMAVYFVEDWQPVNTKDELRLLKKKLIKK